MAGKKNSSAYARAGVDIEKADRFVGSISQMVKTTLNSNVVKSIGGYAALYQIGVDEFIAATTDGVGTKLKLAFELKRHNTVGIDLVAMSVNDLICVGARPLFFLDYFATGKLELKTSKEVLKGIVEGCKQGRVALIGGETAEMPSLYAKGEYDLAGFAVGLVSKDNIIDGSRVKAGDALIALESSGPHSNGYSLIRKLLKQSPKDKKLIEACFKPTRIYVDAVSKLHSDLGVSLKGLAHITGSGFLNIPRIATGVDYEITFSKNFPVGAVFENLKKRGSISWQEMYKTFNMGVGMIAVVDSLHANKALQILEKAGVPAHLAGEVKKGSAKNKSVVRVSAYSSKEKFQIALNY